MLSSSAKWRRDAPGANPSLPGNTSARNAASRTRCPSSSAATAARRSRVVTSEKLSRDRWGSSRKGAKSQKQRGIRHSSFIIHRSKDPRPVPLRGAAGCPQSCEHARTGQNRRPDTERYDEPAGGETGSAAALSPTGDAAGGERLDRREWPFRLRGELD